MISKMPTPMEHVIEFGGHPEDVTITLSGIASAEGFQRFNEARLSDPRFGARMLILLDASSLDTSGMSGDMLQVAIEPMIEHELNYPPLGLAIVAPDVRTFNDAILTRAHLGGSRSRREVFVSRKATRAWLSEQRSGEPGA